METLWSDTLGILGARTASMGSKDGYMADPEAQRSTISDRSSLNRHRLIHNGEHECVLCFAFYRHKPTGYERVLAEQEDDYWDSFDAYHEQHGEPDTKRRPIHGIVESHDERGDGVRVLMLRQCLALLQSAPTVSLDLFACRLERIVIQQF